MAEKTLIDLITRMFIVFFQMVFSLLGVAIWFVIGTLYCSLLMIRTAIVFSYTILHAMLSHQHTPDVNNLIRYVVKLYFDTYFDIIKSAFGKTPSRRIRPLTPTIAIEAFWSLAFVLMVSPIRTFLIYKTVDVQQTVTLLAFLFIGYLCGYWRKHRKLKRARRDRQAKISKSLPSQLSAGKETVR